MSCSCDLIIDKLRHYIHKVLHDKIIEFSKGRIRQSRETLLTLLKHLSEEEGELGFTVVANSVKSGPCQITAKCMYCNKDIYIEPLWTVLSEELGKYGINVKLMYVCIDCAKQETDLLDDEVGAILSLFIDKDKKDLVIKSLVHSIQIKYTQLLCEICGVEYACRVHDLLLSTLGKLILMSLSCS